MRKLTDTVFQGGSVITMIVLELICLYLIINFNSQQRDIWLETVAVYGGGATERVNEIGGYVALRGTVDSLREVVAYYREVATAMNPALTALTSDTITDDSLQQRYVFRPAEVVNRSPYGPYNTCIINRGARDGLTAGQGVVGDRGGIGVVVTTTQRHARVMTLLHRDTRLTAGLSSGYFGTLRWDGRDPRRMTLDDLKDYVPVATGDTVYTTGYSSIFPTGIALGTVAEAARLPGTGNWRLMVSLIGDPLAARGVYVVQDLYKEDIAPLIESR